MITTIINFLGFQLVWWSIIISAGNAQIQWGIGIAIIWMVAHHILNKRYIMDGITSAYVCAGGWCMEMLCQIVDAYALLNYGDGHATVPLWLWVLWIAFGHTIHYSLSWLKKEWQWGIGLALSAPFLYVAVEKVGVISLQSSLDGWLSIIGIWGVGGLLIGGGSKFIKEKITA